MLISPHLRKTKPPPYLTEKRTITIQVFSGQPDPTLSLQHQQQLAHTSFFFLPPFPPHTGNEDRLTFSFSFFFSCFLLSWVARGGRGGFFPSSSSRVFLFFLPWKKTPSSSSSSSSSTPCCSLLLFSPSSSFSTERVLSTQACTQGERRGREAGKITLNRQLSTKRAREASSTLVSLLWGATKQHIFLLLPRRIRRGREGERQTDTCFSLPLVSLSGATCQSGGGRRGGSPSLRVLKSKKGGENESISLFFPAHNIAASTCHI